ncbi:MAG: DUF4127 family protein [Anaerolineaceae bacterium]|nr:DUF4127 family protein [Anaerolineaceae bacterium]
MKPTVAILPMDDRPVNYDYPGYLARLAGCQLVLPERSWLGNPWRPSQHNRLVEWLAQIAPEVDGLILSIDTLAYGGLIPSRTSAEPLEKVLERLQVLRQINEQRPQLPILASSVIQRVSRSSSSEEEKPYWAQYGAEMFRLSYLEHKIACHAASDSEVSECFGLMKRIPSEIYDDYRQGRRRNHAINWAMLDWLAEGIFDYLLLPQDDTAEYGWNIAEARLLQALIRKNGLSERAVTYPGADEVTSLLLARFACQRAAFKPSVWLRYSCVRSPQLITAYEDRPIHEMVKAQLSPLDGILAGSPEEANIQLFINAPVQKQADGALQWIAREGTEGIESLTEKSPQLKSFLQPLANSPEFILTRREMESPEHSIEEFTRAMLASIKAGRCTALADVAFVNGSDLLLGDQLIRNPEIAARMAAYGGWNTAGNTLGTVLAQAALRCLALRSLNRDPEQEQAHNELLFLHFLDDYYYQAIERSRAYLEDLPAAGLSPSWERLLSIEKAAWVSERIRTRLQEDAARLENLFIANGSVEHIQVSDIYLPWQRLFEIGLTVTARLAKKD